MDFSYLHPADQLVMFMQRIYDKSMTTTSGGNLSIKDKDGNIWITPASIDKGTLRREDIVCVKPDGTIEGIHKPSSELPFHSSVYKNRPEMKAVLHAHSPGLVAFSIVRKKPNLSLLGNVHALCGDMPIAVYACPGSNKLGENIGEQFAKGYDVVLLENHGICICAENMFDAFKKFEACEYSANLEILASRLGTPRSLTTEQLTGYGTTDHLTMDSFAPYVPSSEELEVRRDMIKFIRRSYKQGLFTAMHGTYSARLSDGSFIITPYAKDRYYLSESDLVRIYGTKREIDKIPSRAVKAHAAIYEKHPEIKAVMLAHPVNAMAFAVTDAKFDPCTIPESYILLRDVEKLPYEFIMENPEATADHLGVAHPAIMCENNCVIVTGASLLQAFDRLEVMEATAHSIINSLSIGDIQHISKDEVDELKVAFKLQD